ncbi:MAG: M48 family metallopeptidase [Candidatus Delongbacteria bacterium]|nr:M48 family metallopeptidase [Candidatus Delongbacteria bacterium]MBN2835751.1 M48 family metallopeptidase [Candidatus Delongbacteria bacterium]
MSESIEFKYLVNYPVDIIESLKENFTNGNLDRYFLKYYSEKHGVSSDKLLYEFISDLKRQYLKRSSNLSKITFDDKITMMNHAFGLHSYTSRSHGNRVISKNEIRISSLFKNVPYRFLRMIVVHELAHLKEKEHNRAFYRLCETMEPDYHRIEFDFRVYLSWKECKS